MHVPALFVLGFWIVLQFINGIGSVATTSESGGVATWRTSAASSRV